METMAQLKSSLKELRLKSFIENLETLFFINSILN